ncbi:hypothetical protein CC53_gp124 [Rhizobium phage vB_RleS_L338C]|uniref:hypothetical protein n=1 Tax=Rhizobium phage vB_RleS_L338C TaxID=1414737 RepID=UPI0003D96163|nr:hypothetical protein CC53_gp124 [Rhizobium phage vB_RleS_L338C]AHC30541.1 hypothetical protein L338C_124 [Rhizobium phage vB_RleS_L338C]QNH72162.1 hypothetical protein P11VFA_026 [Rhizobium phage P11VFA]
MKRHVRLDDNKPRQGKRRPQSDYEAYLGRICGCMHPNAHPPCSGCTSAIDEEQFEKEMAEELADCLSTYRAISHIIERHHDY